MVININKVILPFIAMLAAVEVQAQTLSFPVVWKKVKEVSPAQQAAHFKTESAQESLSRAEKHWLPRVYLDARSFSTNDPGNALFGLLQQREITANDFSPDRLNHPDARAFTRGALGLDLALYEGGAKSAHVSMADHLLKAEKLGSSQVELEHYGQVGLAYGTIASIRRQKVKLRELSEQIAALLKNYQLGQKSNPVGYSGLLGMKSLAIRIAGLFEQLESQESASFHVLNEMGLKEPNWSPENLDVRGFVNRFFSLEPIQAEGPSSKSMAYIESAKALGNSSQIQKSRHLPRVGVFAESFVFNGSRDTANGYTAGVYLQWELYDPSDFGKYKEAKLTAMAAERMAQSAIQQENAERRGLQESTQTLRSNLLRLEESEKLLAEQTRVSSTLFKNGSIGALQFVEILNRRTDVIAQQAETELLLLKTSVSLVSKTKFEIPDQVSSGGGL